VTYRAGGWYVAISVRKYSAEENIWAQKGEARQ